MRLLTIGSATYDILIQYKNIERIYRDTALGRQPCLLLQEGRKLDIDDVTYKTGGGATNAAVAFARLGFFVEAFFAVGDDFQGDYLVDLLRQEGVSLSHIQRIPDTPTNVSFVIASPSADRTVLVYRGASRALRIEQLPVEVIRTSDGIYITSLSDAGMEQLSLIVRTARQQKRVVAVNPGSSQLQGESSTLRAALPMIDILILNRFEATLLMHAFAQAHGKEMPFTLPAFCTMILELGTRIVVVTDGVQGVYVATGNMMLFHPSLPVGVVGTLGAGDAFGSAFTAAVVRGDSLDDAMRMGILNSSSVIGHIDAKTGLLTQLQMEKRLAGLDKNLLQKLRL